MAGEDAGTSGFDLGDLQGLPGATAGARLDVKKVAAARLWAATRFPYLASALFASQVLGRPGIGTIAVDEHWRLYADPALVDGMTVPELGTVMVHHTGHLLRDHADRARGQGIEDDERMAQWMRAADAEINDDLVDAGLLKAEDTDLPADFGAKNGGFAEEYYAKIRISGEDGDEADEDEPDSDDSEDEDEDDGGKDGGEQDQGGQDGAGDQGEQDQAGDEGDGEGGESGEGDDPGHGEPGHQCGSGSHGVQQDWEESSGDGGVPKGSGHLLRCSVAAATRRHAGLHPGTVPEGWLRWADSLLVPKVDWRRVLAAEIKRGLSNAAGKVDYSYRRPSRRAGAVPGVILPSLYKPIPEVAVVCDTSGSMGEDLLGQALAEIEGLLKGVGLRNGQLRVLAVDAAVHAVTRVAKANQVVLQGGGGTDMGAGIAAAAKLKPRPSVVVVLTDGYTPWPHDPPPGIRIVVGILGQGTGTSQYGTPPWARVVHIDDAA